MAKSFQISKEPLNVVALKGLLGHEAAGAYVEFEGRVRNHNQGHEVLSLDYEVYEPLALSEGEKILREAAEKFDLHGVHAVHRYGELALGEVAIWIGATASHRDAAFKATRYVIDQVKKRLPVWKKENYKSKESKWVYCRDHEHHVHLGKKEFYTKQRAVLDEALIENKKVLVVGAGGLGCHVLTSLVSAGVGHVRFVDYDFVEVSNLPRQPLYTTQDLGAKKVVVAERRLRQLNPLVKVESLEARLDTTNVLTMIDGRDLVVDCTDNLPTKFLLHDACFEMGIALVSASLFKEQAQLRSFIPESEAGCLRCYSPKGFEWASTQNCNDVGILGSHVGLVAQMQASEALSFLSGGEVASSKETIVLDLKNFSQIRLKASINPKCECQHEGFDLQTNTLEKNLEAALQLGAKLVDIRKLSDEEVREQLDKDSLQFLYCDRGNRSLSLTAKLRGEGYGQVYSLKGGACSL